LKSKNIKVSSFVRKAIAEKNKSWLLRITGQT
jgi:hypothetical protein